MRSVGASEIDIDRIWSENDRIWIERIRSQSVSEIQGTIFARVILDLEIIVPMAKSENFEFRNLD